MNDWLEFLKPRNSLIALSSDFFFCLIVKGSCFSCHTDTVDLFSKSEINQMQQITCKADVAKVLLTIFIAVRSDDC